MIDLGWIGRQALGASQDRPARALSGPCCRPKAAQAQAERHDLTGLAAALVDAAATLAREPGVDPAAVQALAGGRPATAATCRAPLDHS